MTASVLTPRTLLIAASLTMGACGGPTMVLDEAEVASQIQHIDEAVPTCHGSESGAVTRKAIIQMLDILEGLRLTAPLDDQRVPISGVDSYGSCGGQVSVSYSHESGVTDYESEFKDYCVTSDEGDIVYSGTFKARENGTPSDYGPVISSLEASTDGQVRVAHAGETIAISIDGVRTDYGVPDTWSPGTPTEENPDVTEVSEITVSYESHGREDYGKNLQVERHGPTGMAILAIKKGELGTTGGDHVRISTGDGSLMVNISDGTVLGGSLELQGAEDTVVRVIPREGEPGVYDIELNGEPFQEALDCAEGEAPKAETIVAILQAIPIH